MNCPFNIKVGHEEINTGYEGHKFNCIDYRLSEVVTCLEERCGAWVDVVVGEIWPECPPDVICTASPALIIEKRCARLVNPNSIVQKGGV